MAIDTFEFGHWPIPDTPNGKGQRHSRMRRRLPHFDLELLVIAEASVLAAMGKNVGSPYACANYLNDLTEKTQKKRKNI